MAAARSAPVAARHRFQRGDADQGFFQRHAQAAHEGQADTLAGESAGTGGDRQPVQRRESDAGFRMVSSTIGASRFGMAARHFLKMMGEDFFAVQHGDRTGAQRGIDRQPFQRILHASSKERRGLRGNTPAGSP